MGWMILFKEQVFLSNNNGNWLVWKCIAQLTLFSQRFASHPSNKSWRTVQYQTAGNTKHTGGGWWYGLEIVPDFPTATSTFNVKSNLFIRRDSSWLYYIVNTSCNVFLLRQVQEKNRWNKGQMHCIWKLSELTLCSSEAGAKWWCNIFCLTSGFSLSPWVPRVHL